MTEVTLKVSREEAVRILNFLNGNAEAPKQVFRAGDNVAQPPAAPVVHAPAVPAAPAYAPPAQPQAPAAPAYAPPAAPQVAHQPQPPIGGVAITVQQLSKAAQEYSKATSPTATKAIFKQFGISKISEASPAIYAQLLEALRVA